MLRVSEKELSEAKASLEEAMASIEAEVKQLRQEKSQLAIQARQAEVEVSRECSGVHKCPRVALDVHVREMDCPACDPQTLLHLRCCSTQVP